MGCHLVTVHPGCLRMLRQRWGNGGRARRRTRPFVTHRRVTGLRKLAKATPTPVPDKDLAVPVVERHRVTCLQRSCSRF